MMKQKGIAADAEKAYLYTRAAKERKGGTTPVATERVRKLLRIEGIAGCRGAKECVIS